MLLTSIHFSIFLTLIQFEILTLLANVIRLFLADSQEAFMLQQKHVAMVGLILITIFLTADQAALVPNYLLVESEFGITHAQVGMVTSAFVIVVALATVFWGYLTDKFSRKKLLLIGTLLGEIPCFLTAFVNSYFELFLIRTLTGFGIGVILPVASSLFADYFPSGERGKVFGWFLFAIGLSYLVGAGLAGIVGPTLGWRYPFMIIAAPNFVLAPLFYLLMSEPTRGQMELRSPLGKTSPREYRVKFSHLARFITIKTNLYLNLQSIFAGIPLGVLGSWIITFFVQERGLSIAMATSLGLVFIGMRIFGNVSGGYAGDYVSQKKVTYRVLLCITAMLVAMPFILASISSPLDSRPSFSQILVLFVLGFFGVGLASVPSANVRAIFLDVNVPENRGIMLSIANLTDVVGVGIGPLIGGLLADRYSLSFALKTSTLFWILSALIWIPLIRTLPGDMYGLSVIMKKRASEIRNHNER